MVPLSGHTVVRHGLDWDAVREQVTNFITAIQNRVEGQNK